MSDSVKARNCRTYFRKGGVTVPRATAVWQGDGKSELAGVIRYARARWPTLLRYRDDGRLEIDNNGGERAAAIYSRPPSSVTSIPRAYLCDVLRIADHPVSRVDELLP